MDSTTYSVEYAYDANSNRTSIKYPDGISFTYRYDGRDSLTQLKRGSLVLVSYASDSHGRPKSQTTAGNATATLNYDTISRVNEIKHNFSGTGYDLTLGFAYNPASQLVTQNLSNGRFYHQGRTAQTGTYSVNGLNQYTKIDGKAITHDANGNFKSDSVTNYTYDVENRLISVVGAHNGLLHYDPMGRLYKINAHDTGKTTYFLYSGDSLIAEYQSGQMTQRYVHGGGGLAPRVGYDGSSTAAAYLRFLHTNHQGSVIAQSNNSGAVTNINTYDEYGVPGSGNAGRFSYTGQMHLPEIGLYHYRARMYNPFTGRFLQTDPIGYADQMNLYAYVGNDPVNKIDPTGKSCTMNDKTKSAECKVDDRGNWKKKDIARIEKRYTKVVNKMLKNPDKKATVKVGDKSFETSAGAQAKILMDAKVIAGGKSKTGRAHAQGGPLIPNSKSGGPEITINKNVLSDAGDRRIDTTFVHESLHLNPAEAVMQDLWDAGPGKFNQDHRSRYNDAADDLF